MLVLVLLLVLALSLCLCSCLCLLVTCAKSVDDLCCTLRRALCESSVVVLAYLSLVCGPFFCVILFATSHHSASCVCGSYRLCPMALLFGCLRRFAPSFNAARAVGTADAFRAIMREDAPGVMSFEMFTPQFCAMLVDEMRVR